MRRVYNAEDHAWLVETISDYERSGVVVTPLVRYGRHSITERVESGSYGAGDGYGWDLSMDVTGNLPRDARNAPVSVIASFDGFLFPAFEGDVSWPTSQNRTTNVLAGTPGTRLDKKPLRQPVEYLQRTPQWVYRDALMRIPLYDFSRLSIPKFDQPLIDALLKNGDAFADSQYPADIIATVEEKVGCKGYDTPVGRGHKVKRSIGTGEDEEIAWAYDASDHRQVLERFEEPTPAGPDEQYTSVWVRDRYEDGTLRVDEEVAVDYSGWEYPPLAGTPLIIDFSATEDDSAEAAYQRAWAEAQALRNLIHDFSATVAYNLLLDPSDVITFASTYEDDTGLYRRLWRVVLESVSNSWDYARLYSTLGGRAVLLDEARLPDPPIVLRGITAYVVTHDALALLVRETEEEVLIEDSVPWLVDEGETVLLTDNAIEEAETVLVTR